MARGNKKESTLSPEEKLIQALVPDWEQPYKVPVNWCWTKIGAISDFERGITFPASAKETDPTEVNIPCLRTANVQENLETDDLIYVNRSFMKGNDAKLVRENDIIMSSANSRELVGKASYVTQVPFPMTFGGFVLNIRARGISSKYLFYFLRQEFLAGKFMGESTQTTNIANINTTTLGSYELPLPPLAEQQRIVTRIEHLFAKLDEAKEKAQSVLDSFETRKAVILHKAFTGELTAKWRAEHGVKMDSWHALTFGDLITSAKNGTTVKQNKEKNDYPVTRIETLQGGTLDFSRLGYIIDPDTVSPEDYYVAGDVAFSHINSAAHVGKTALIESAFLPLIHGMNLLRIRLNERCIPEYFIWYSRSADYKEQILQRINMAVNQVSINQKQLKTMPINVPKTQEQREIIRILDSIFAKEQQAKEAADAVLEKIDLLKKSILARAFRGELGTNNPAEESSLELLKKII